MLSTKSVTRLRVTGLLAAIAAALPVASEVKTLRAVELDTAPGTAERQGFVTNDLFMESRGEYSGTHVLDNLAQGSAYQHQLEHNRSLDPTMFHWAPALLFDPFAPPNGPIAPSFSGDLGDLPSCLFDDLRVDCGWALPGDYNDNGRVEQGDLDLVLLNWGDEVSNEMETAWVSDLPLGTIAQEALDDVLLGWGNSADGSTTVPAVPEPFSLVLALVLSCLATQLGIGSDIFADVRRSVVGTRSRDSSC